MLTKSTNTPSRGAVRFAVSLLLCALGGARTAGADPFLYVSNFGNNTVTVYDVTTGALLGTPVTAGPEALGFNDLEVLPSGDILVAPQFSSNLVRYSPTGAVAQILDPGNAAGVDPALGLQAQGMTIGPDGKLYVASVETDKILRYDAATGAFLDVFADLSGLGHVGPIAVVFGPDGKLYVTGFYTDYILQLDPDTGAVTNKVEGPAGLGFAAAAFADSSLYVEAVDLTTFQGTVLRYNLPTNQLTGFIPPGTAGLQAVGALGFDPSGNLLLASLAFDAQFNDIGSSLLRFDAHSGAFIDTLIGPGQGLNVPFYLTVSEVAPAAASVPEPSTAILLALGLASLITRSRWSC